MGMDAASFVRMSLPSACVLTLLYKQADSHVLKHVGDEEPHFT